jgi:hypothetical protein
VRRFYEVVQDARPIVHHAYLRVVNAQRIVVLRIIWEERFDGPEGVRAYGGNLEQGMAGFRGKPSSRRGRLMCVYGVHVRASRVSPAAQAIMTCRLIDDCELMFD